MVKELKCCLKNLEQFVKNWNVCNIHSHLCQLVTMSCIKTGKNCSDLIGAS